jgi:hypothetical protein
MNRTIISRRHTQDPCSLMHPAAAFLILLWFSAAALAQTNSQSTNLTNATSVRATHLLGFESAKNNANGTLSIQADALQFQRDGKPAIQVKIASLQDVFLGEQSKQVGGTAMTLGKVAVPFGGGRAVSLFAHKKYDTLSLEYVDSNGGVHGAIFQLNKGQGEILRNELVAKGAHVSESRNEPTKQSNAEVLSESK